MYFTVVQLLEYYFAAVFKVQEPYKGSLGKKNLPHF